MSGNVLRGNVLRIYALEAKYEFLKVVRLPMYAIPTLAFPLLFYGIFGIAMAERFAGAQARYLSTYMMASYGCFGVMGAALFGFGVGVAVERGQGWMLVKRATPMPPFAHLWGKLAMALVFGTLIVLCLFTLGATAGGVRLALWQWPALAAVCVAGAIPFGAFGLAIGYLAGPNSAVPIVNLLYLPMAFASGMWIPIDSLPETMQRVALWLPSYHYAQLALAVIGADRGGPVAVSAAALAGFAALSLAVAWVAYRRDEGRTFG